VGKVTTSLSIRCVGTRLSIKHLANTCTGDAYIMSRIANVAGFSLRAGIMTEAHQRDKLERLQPNYIIFRTRTVAFDGNDHPRRASLVWRDGERVAFARLPCGV